MRNWIEGVQRYRLTGTPYLQLLKGPKDYSPDLDEIGPFGFIKEYRYDAVRSNVGMEIMPPSQTPSSSCSLCFSFLALLIRESDFLKLCTGSQTVLISASTYTQEFLKQDLATSPIVWSLWHASFQKSLV